MGLPISEMFEVRFSFWFSLFFFPPFWWHLTKPQFGLFECGHLKALGCSIHMVIRWLKTFRANLLTYKFQF